MDSSNGSSKDNPPDIEYSESGAPIYRHKARRGEFEQPTGGDREAIARIEAHIAEHLGEPAWVWHEIVSDLVHLDVHVIEPTPERAFYTLITTGMSDRPMAAPDRFPDLNHAELLLCLPPDWPVNEAAFEDEANYWPVRWLKMLARLPHEYNTWLWQTHTVPNGDPPQPYAPNTALCCMFVAPPLLAGESFLQLPIRDGKTVHFHALVPLYVEEMNHKLRHGADALFERLDANHVTELLDITRANTCA